MKRRREFRRNELLEKELKILEGDFEASECALRTSYQEVEERYPLIFIFGPMRSGTTLFMQWLASMGHFAYPTNMLSRFYYAPLMGAKIQNILTSPLLQFRDELSDISGSSDFTSENGKTSGSLAPNEFWYFWGRHIKYEGRDFEEDDVLDQTVNKKNLKAEFSGLVDIFGKPFAAKAMKYNFNASYLRRVFPKALFVRLERDLESNAESVLAAREKQFGTTSSWYSIKVPEYDRLIDLEPYDQVVGQISSINNNLKKAFSEFSDDLCMTVKYEEFCGNPQDTYAQLNEKLGKLGFNLPKKYEGAEVFNVTRGSGLNGEKLNRALRNLKKLGIIGP